MSYQLIKNITTVNYTKGIGRAIKYIVLHYTGNLVDTAKNNANYFKSINRGASAHYFVDETTACQVVEDADIAWSVGKNYGGNNLFGTVTNANSINVEMCSSGGRIADATFNNAAALVKSLMENYNIPASNVYRHYDVCSKQCPGWSGWGTTKNDSGALWTRFKNAITAKEEKTMATVQLYEFNGTDAQKWQPKHNADGTISLENKACGLYLDVAGANSKPGGVIQAYKGNKTISQKFIMKQYDGNYAPSFAAPIYIAPSTNKSLRLDCINGGKSNGTKIQIFTANNSGAQKWTILDAGDGYWSIINVISGKALDVAGGGK